MTDKNLLIDYSLVFAVESNCFVDEQIFIDQIIVINTPWETACLLACVCTVQPSQIGVDVVDVISVIKGQKKSGHKAINEFLKYVGS